MTAPQAPTPLSMPGAQAGIQAVQAQGGVVPPPAGQPQAPQPAPQLAQPAPTPQVQEVPAQQPAQQPAGDRQPPWGSTENFEPDRAWRLIENLRDELKTYKERTDPIVEQHEKQRRDALDESARLKEDLGRTSTELDAWRTTAVQSTAKSLAESRFVDADAALALVGDLSQFSGNGRVNTDALSLAFDEIATKHPVLVAQQPQQQGWAPNRGQGASGTPVTAAQTAAHALSQGDVRGSMAAKAQMLSELPRQ